MSKKKKKKRSGLKRVVVQGCSSMSDIGHRPIEFAKCLFDFSVERTNVPLLACQRGCCLVIIIFFFFATLGHHIADPVTGWSPTV